MYWLRFALELTLPSNEYKWYTVLQLYVYSLYLTSAYVHVYVATDSYTGSTHVFIGWALDTGQYFKKS